MAKKKPSNRLLNPLGLIKDTRAKLVRGGKLNWKYLFRLGLYALGALAVVGVIMVIVFSFDLPKPGQIAQFQATSSTKLYDRNGALLYDIYGEEKRTVVPSADIPKAAKDATVALEDRSFYSHHGVNFRAIGRAIFIDFLRHSPSQGGSTITQQLVRNAIEGVGTQKSITRKIKEVILALEFERIHTKDEILTLYMNQIPYGNNLYGIESASQGYFGKSAKDLNPDTAKDDAARGLDYSQIATLVSLPQAPTFYNPYGNHVDQLKSRRDITLQKMADQGYISQSMASLAKTHDVSEGIIRTSQAITAPHFVFEVRQQLVDLLGGGQIGETRLDSGGYKVTTTLDLNLQHAAEQAISTDSPSIFKNTQASNAALVSVDVKTGQVLAMVGSANYSDKTFGSVNVTTSPRQPGSSFKPLVYASLFKKAFSPGSTIFDLEGNYDQARPNEIWPHNYSGSGQGPLPIRSTLAQSLNISAVKAQALSGTDNAIQTAQDLGITALGTPDQYGLAMVLGAAEVKMTDMVGAYSAFGNGGIMHQVSEILKVEDKNGQVIQEWKDTPKQAIDENIAYEISSILSDNVARTPEFGAHSPLILPDRPVAAKTGTTSDYKDAWTIGFTPQIATAVWVGNNNNKEMTHSGAGAMAAAPIWHDYMVKAHTGLPVQTFNRPDGVRDCTIARYSNKKPTASTPPENIIHDICTDWQMPTQDDDSYKAVKLYGPDQTKLATADTPLGLVVTKLFMNIHSERPNDPVWEQPVQAWAARSGLGSAAIPTAQYDPAAANDKLTTSIVTPADGSVVKGDIQLHALASSSFGVSLMTFYIDDQQIGQPNAPWTIQLDTTKLADGKHVFKAVAQDLQNQQQSASATFTVDNNNTVVIISSPSAARSGVSVTITWQTDVAADGVVQYGPSTSYGTNATESGGPTTSHSVTISGLNPAITYHYMITSKTSGATGSSVDLTF